MKSSVVSSFEKHIEEHLKQARNYKYYYHSNPHKSKSMKKAWKSSRRPHREKVDIDDHTVNEIVNSIQIENETPEDFLESFCHRYTNINTAMAASVTERMLADIEKRERKQHELEKAEKAYKLMHQRPLDKEEKDM